MCDKNCCAVSEKGAKLCKKPSGIQIFSTVGNQSLPKTRRVASHFKTLQMYTTWTTLRIHTGGLAVGAMTELAGGIEETFTRGGSDAAVGADAAVAVGADVAFATAFGTDAGVAAFGFGLAFAFAFDVGAADGVPA